MCSAYQGTSWFQWGEAGKACCKQAGSKRGMFSKSQSEAQSEAEESRKCARQSRPRSKRGAVWGTCRREEQGLRRHARTDKFRAGSETILLVVRKVPTLKLISALVFLCCSLKELKGS
ncbi:hypothetical protein ISCGN_030557 [Ixodes scapularis]